MYHPILRGKQFELIALRELAKSLPEGTIRPIIDPVRNKTSPMIKTIKELNKNHITPIIITNPQHGDFNRSRQVDLVQDLREDANGEISIIPCIRIASASDHLGVELIEKYRGNAATFLESGIEKSLIPVLNNSLFSIINREKIPPAALSQINKAVLYGDYFDKKQRNKDYGERTTFSTLHAEYKHTLKSDRIIGFGDFTILSEAYSEAGGPAYVVTIHLSYIDDEEFETMFVLHFSSESEDDSPTIPGEKFKEALAKLVAYYHKNEDKILRTTGLNEFLETHKIKHFPGLGQVKKMSMKHHIETTCHYIKE